MGRLGQSMLKVAPPGKRVLNSRFARTPENGAPTPRRASLKEISPLATLGRNDRMAGWPRAAEEKREKGGPSGYEPHAAEVPSFALFDASIFSGPLGRLGQSMLKVAPHGKRVLNSRFARTPENGAPISRTASLKEISPLASGFAYGYAVTRRSVEMTGWRVGHERRRGKGERGAFRIRASCGGGAIFCIV